MDKKSSKYHMKDIYESKYLKYKSKYLKLKNQNNSCGSCIQTGGSKKLDIILFKADWCFHCKKFFSTWEEMKKKYKKDYNFIIIDSTETEQLKSWNVNSFPTIYVKNNNIAIEYEGIREEEDIIKFVDQVKLM
jgi:thiol-disulfide isomerase/thioredoxin